MQLFPELWRVPGRSLALSSFVQAIPGASDSVIPRIHDSMIL